MVYLFEALFLLALDDDEGEILDSVASDVEAILSGAVLAELVLQHRLDLVDGRIVVTDHSATENPVLDKALFDILDTARSRKLKYWLNTFSYKKLSDEIVHALVEKGILVRKKKHLHLVKRFVNSLAGDVSAQYEVKHRLREIVLAVGQAELSDKVLLAFLHHGKMLRLAFTPGERKTANKRVKKLIAGEEGSGLGEPLDTIVISACDANRSG
jgi:hypothetical protein